MPGTPVPAPPKTPCIVWGGHIDKQSGYGTVKVGGRNRQAHVVLWEAERGPVLEGLVLDHLCRNLPCVRPDHLEPVTPAVNTMRGLGACAVNARKTECPKGHPYDDANTRWYRGHRQCWTCRRAANAARKTRVRAEARAQGLPRPW